MDFVTHFQAREITMHIVNQQETAALTKQSKSFSIAQFWIIIRQRYYFYIVVWGEPGSIPLPNKVT